MNDLAPSQIRFDVHRVVTESIVAAIERGAGSFVMPWHGCDIARPQNALTRMEYHGVNIVALWSQACVAGFASSWWATYRQWQQIGAQVKRGERASTIVFFKRIEDAQEDEGVTPATRLVARASRVFNADQVAGWEPPKPLYWRGSAEAIEAVETFVNASKAEIHHAGTTACYRIQGDYIQMPPRTAFTGSPTSSPTESYNATLLHELVHWSGAKARLDRGFDKGLRREALAAEELIAELGAAYLCADLGVSNEPRPDHAAYVASWLRQFRDDKRAIFTASRLADRATNFLHELAVVS